MKITPTVEPDTESPIVKAFNACCSGYDTPKVIWLVGQEGLNIWWYYAFWERARMALENGGCRQ